MALSSGGRRLKQWLVEQISSELYPGLLWENDTRTMFRIPWKHAGKQDYNQEVDASIFKAWAVFKGKYKDGEKAEPATWKTRLRCALNKSPDFEEVTDRSQLDISEPYKVYRIVPEEEQKTGKSAGVLAGGCAMEGPEVDCSSAELEELMKETSADEYDSPLEDGLSTQPGPGCWQHNPHCAVVPHQDPALGTYTAAFSQMLITFYYSGCMMGSTLTTQSEGCRVAPSPLPLAGALPYSADSLQSVRLPPPDLIGQERQRHVTLKLLRHLQRGVLLRANREGIFIKRLCQSRVFCCGADGQHVAPCRLERDAVVKIFDTTRFLHALQLHQDGQGVAPDPAVYLCFGEEFSDISTAKSKLIILQVKVVSCQQLLEAVNARRAQYGSGHLEMSDELASEQMAHIYQELCSYSVPPRPAGYRDNMPITA